MRLGSLSPSHWAALVILVFSGCLYLSTLQTDINGVDNAYTPDVGEIVIALNLGGIMHQPGYPLFSMLGSAFVALIKIAGVGPALAAGLWSWGWGVTAIGLTYGLALRLTQRWWIAAPTAVAYAVTRSIWINASIAEVQTFTICLAALTLLLALCIDDHQQKLFHLLAFVFGCAISHQRALVLLGLPLAALLARPYFNHIRRQPFSLALDVFLVAAPWLAYLYLPLRVNAGAIWTFGKPNTWEGLRPFITAEETRGPANLPATLAEWLDRTRIHLEVLNTEWVAGLTLIGLGILLVLILAPHWRRRAVFLTLTWLPFFAAAYTIYIGKVWDAYLVVLMPVTLMGILGLGTGIAALADTTKPRLGTGAAVMLMVIGVWSGQKNFAEVYKYKANAYGRGVINTFKQIRDFRGPGSTILSAVWGLDYFSLAYGALVTQEIPNVTIYDQNAPYVDLLNTGARVYVLPRMFYVFDLNFWDAKLGRTYLTSAAPGLVQISNRPPLKLAEAPPGTPTPIGDSITLLTSRWTFDATANTLHISLYWEAAAPPAQDYSVFVHLSDAAVISSGADILAQWDSAAPVYGFYPTTRWGPGEIVREDYVIPLPDARKPILLRVGLYTRTADGGFNNLGEANFPITIP